jgi:hypothetical protein
MKLRISGDEQAGGFSPSFAARLLPDPLHAADCPDQTAGLHREQGIVTPGKGIEYLPMI